MSSRRHRKLKCYVGAEYSWNSEKYDFLYLENLNEEENGDEEINPFVKID